MKIKSIKIQNFYSFESVEVNFEKFKKYYVWSMSTTIYNIELDWIIIEKIIMRAVLAVVSYNCVIT